MAAPARPALEHCYPGLIEGGTAASTENGYRNGHRHARAILHCCRFGHAQTAHKYFCAAPATTAGGGPLAVRGVNLMTRREQPATTPTTVV